jgi:hypothetical protein
LQLRVLRFSFLQDGNVGVGVFPEGEEVLVGGLALDAVACSQATNETKTAPATIGFFMADSNCPVLLLLHNLARFSGNYLGLPSITRDLSSHANIRILIFRFGCAEFGTITPPNQDSKILLRIRLIEVQERGLTFTLSGLMRSDYFSADGSDYADVIFGLSRGDLAGLRCGAECE